MATTDTAKTGAARTRDRGATAARILDAAASALCTQGFAGLGVNALAAAAGVDKQLIYRYFGGIDGVVRALGERLEFWLGGALPVAPGEPYADAVTRLLQSYQTQLRGNSLLQGILAWELVEVSAPLQELERARSETMERWAAGIRAASRDIPAGIDAPAINALLLAGIHHLVLKQRSVGRFAGIDLSSDSGWARIESALTQLTGLAFGNGAHANPKQP